LRTIKPIDYKLIFASLEKTKNFKESEEQKAIRRIYARIKNNT
jgi:pyruvate/2-oxoglutarate/acetoin dehydrogenase E1 component